jgi:hypothetical protein
MASYRGYHHVTGDWGDAHPWIVGGVILLAVSVGIFFLCDSVNLPTSPRFGTSSGTTHHAAYTTWVPVKCGKHSTVLVPVYHPAYDDFVVWFDDTSTTVNGCADAGTRFTVLVARGRFTGLRYVRSVFRTPNPEDSRGR